MGSSYTRQSSYNNGDIIDAGLTNAEFDQLVSVFDAATGHSHDGTEGEGGPIDAVNVVFDDTTANMGTVTVQGALDDLDARVDAINIVIDSGPVQSIDGQTGIVTLADINLDNIDNTSDADKPISTATQSALDSIESLVGHSTTNVTIGTGTKIFTIESGKGFLPGHIVKVSVDSDPVSSFVVGSVTTYATDQLEILVTSTEGSGAFAAWTVGITVDVADIEGSSGILRAPTGGGTLTQKNAYHAFVEDSAYVLPDFTDSDNFGLASLESSAAVPSTVETSDGWTIPTTGLAASTTALTAPISVATAHGTWGSSLVVDPPLLTSLTASAAPLIEGVAELTPGLVVIMYSVSSNTEAFVVALDTDTNTFGLPVSLGTVTGGVGAFEKGIYTNTTTTFFTYRHNTNVAFRAGSVSGTAITLGSELAGTGNSTVPVVQLKTGEYFFTSIVQSESISQAGTLLSKSSALSTTLSGTGKAMRVSDTTALTLAAPNGASQALQAVVSTAGGAAIVQGTVVTSGENVIATSGTEIMQAFDDGGPYLVGCQDQTTATTMRFFAVTVAATVPTIGTSFSRTTTSTVDTYPVTYQFPNAVLDDQQDMIAANATNMLIGIGAQPFALSVSGTTLSEGTGLTGIGASTAIFDGGTGLVSYVVGATTIDTVTVSAGTITSSLQLSTAGKVSHVSTTTLNDQAVNYSGIWYAWALGSPIRMITPDKWAYISGSDIELRGEIT